MRQLCSHTSLLGRHVRLLPPFSSLSREFNTGGGLPLVLGGKIRGGMAGERENKQQGDQLYYSVPLSRHLVHGKKSGGKRGRVWWQTKDFFFCSSRGRRKAWSKFNLIFDVGIMGEIKSISTYLYLDYKCLLGFFRNKFVDLTTKISLFYGLGVPHTHGRRKMPTLPFKFSLHRRSRQSTHTRLRRRRRKRRRRRRRLLGN